MFVHAVYFTVRDDLTPAERARFESGLQSLRGIESVQQGHVGVPAPTSRGDVERGYTHALVLTFADAAAQDVYQRHPVHDRFREDCAGYWRALRIYDSTDDAAA